MQREHVVTICHADLAGQTRGKGFPASELPKRLALGVGWTPTNIQLSAFGPIADTPFGPFGDLVLMPDPTTEVRLDFGENRPIEHFLLADATETDGTPWSCCPRSFLKTALRDLEDEFGLHLLAAFEHEFYHVDAIERASSAYNLDALRRHGSPKATSPSTARGSTRSRSRQHQDWSLPTGP
jgi:glutamine synthetase